jgi:ribulose-phosphate 3-epimerase
MSEKIISKCPLPVDAHLMVASVDSVAISYAQAGCASVTIHVEACSDIRQTLQGIKKCGARAAIAVKPNTSITEYSEFFDLIDMVLIMTVEPGFGGQKFMTEMMEKVSKARSLIGPEIFGYKLMGEFLLKQ